jgi:hypothetical protein
MCENNDGETVPREVFNMREKFKAVRVHAPHLNSDMEPAFELFNMGCPFEKVGKCWTCPDFAGIWTPEGTVFSYDNYEGYCAHGLEVPDNG